MADGNEMKTSSIWAWVKGMVAVCTVGWMAWVSTQLAEGGRFTAAEGQVLLLAQAKLEARQDADDAWKQRLAIPPDWFIEKVDDINTQLVQTKVVMRDIDNRLTRIETSLSQHNETMRLSIEAAKAKGKAEHEERFHDTGGIP